MEIYLPQKDLIYQRGLGKITSITGIDNSFVSIFNTLKNDIQCTYLFYLFQNSKKKQTIILTSNDEWQSLFINSGLLYQCPVIKFGLKYFSNPQNRSYVMIWNKIPLNSKEETNVHGLRSEFNIANGLSYAHQNSYFREALGVAGDKKDYDFYRHFINDRNLIKKILISLRNLKECKALFF